MPNNMEKKEYETILRERLCAPVNKLAAAKTVHEFLLDVLNEKDESDWSAAMDLFDIYDCKKCVRHVAQVYVKGIILPKNKNEFGTQELLTSSDIDGMIERILNKKGRMIPALNNSYEIRYIQYEDLKGPEFEKALIKDLRDTDLEAVRLNPYMISDNTVYPIVLKCQYGYKSTLVAELLKKAGYKNIYVLKP